MAVAAVNGAYRAEMRRRGQTLSSHAARNSSTRPSVHATKGSDPFVASEALHAGPSTAEIHATKLIARLETR